jgi:hypothetical protein
MVEPAIETLPERWYEGRLSGHPLIKYKQGGSVMIQVDGAWLGFKSEDDAEHYLTYNHEVTQ